MRVSEARESFADAVNRVAYSGERIVLNRRGKRLAAIVPVKDLDLIEAVEDRIDLAKVKARLLDKSLPLDKVLRNLGL
jgi:prevent-host-death family protein